MRIQKERTEEIIGKTRLKKAVKRRNIRGLANKYEVGQKNYFRGG